MLFQSVGFWNVVIDGIQIFLCLLILIFLFKNRRGKRKPVWQEGKNSFRKDFNTQIFTQTIKQHADQAFANIFEAISTEQRRLERLLIYDQEQNNVSGLTDFQYPSQPSAIHEISGLSETGVKKGDRREKIIKLSSKGVNVEKISEELKTPIDEVELVLSLNRNERT